MNQGTEKYNQWIKIMTATSVLLLLYLIAMLIILKFLSKVCCMIYIFQWVEWGGEGLVLSKGLKLFWEEEQKVVGIQHCLQFASCVRAQS